jgi:hypothetical protein
MRAMIWPGFGELPAELGQGGNNVFDGGALRAL